jgi:hypothetical protein
VTRFVDRGAITAAWVGVGMAVTIAVSFLLIIPIEFVYVTLLPVPAGLLIGYYANARSGRIGGPWRRLLTNGAFAGLVTGLTFALLFLAVKALFFNADSGYRDAPLGGPLACETGADCVYQRYLADGRGDALAAAGVTDVESFTQLYWQEQLTTGLTVLLYATFGALGGAAMYGITNRKDAATVARDRPTA